jgi:hypothetical protein
MAEDRSFLPEDVTAGDLLLARQRFDTRVGGKFVVGTLNFGIDILNRFQEEDRIFRPVELDRDIFEPAVRTAASAVRSAAGEDAGKMAKAFLEQLTKPAESVGAEMSEDAAVFLLGFLGARKPVQAATQGLLGRGATQGTWGRMGVDAIAGFGADFILSDPSNPNLLGAFLPEDKLGEFGELFAYRADEDYDRLTGRFQHALEGLGLGVLGDMAVHTIAKRLSAGKVANDSRFHGEPEVANQTAAEMTGLPVPSKAATDTFGSPTTGSATTVPYREFEYIDMTQEAIEASAKATREAITDLQVDAATHAQLARDVLWAHLDPTTAIREGVDTTVPLATAVQNAINVKYINFENPKAAIETAAQVVNALTDVISKRGSRSFDGILESAKRMGIEIPAEKDLMRELGAHVDTIKEAQVRQIMFRMIHVQSANEWQRVISKIMETNTVDDALAQQFQNLAVTTTFLQRGITEAGSEIGMLLNLQKYEVNEAGLKAFARKATTTLDNRTSAIVEDIRQEFSKSDMTDPRFREGFEDGFNKGLEIDEPPPKTPKEKPAKAEGSEGTGEGASAGGSAKKPKKPKEEKGYTTGHEAGLKAARRYKKSGAAPKKASTALAESLGDLSKPKGVTAKAQKRIENLTKKLERLRKRFGDDKILKAKGARIKPPEVREIETLKSQIKFYKTAEAEARKLVRLEDELAKLQAAVKKGTPRAAVEALPSKVKRKPEVPPRIAEVKKEIAEAKAELKKTLKKAERNASLTDKIYDELTREMSLDQARAELPGVAKDKDEILAMARKLQRVDLKKLKAGDLAERNTWDFIRGLSVRNMLSGLTTQAVTLHSGVFTSVFTRGFEDVLAASMKTGGSQTGRLTAKAQMNAIRKSISAPFDHLRLVGKAWWDMRGQGMSWRQIADQLSVDPSNTLLDQLGSADIYWNADHTFANLWNTYARYLDNMSMGIMTVADTTVKRYNFEAEIRSIYGTVGLDRGLKDEALEMFIQNNLDQALVLARNPQEASQHILKTLVDKHGFTKAEAIAQLAEKMNYVGRATELARGAVYQDEISSAFLKNLEGGLNSRNPIAQAAKTFVIPFYKTAVKLIEFSVDRTPILNRLSKKNQEILNGLHGVREKQRLMAKTRSGAMLWGAAGTLAYLDVLTGKHHPEERDALIAAGIPEYSIRIPGTNSWMSYSRTDPFGMFLSIAADTANTIRMSGDESLDLEKLGVGAIYSFANSVGSRTWMKGVSDLTEAIFRPHQHATWYLDQKARGLIAPGVGLQRSFEKLWGSLNNEIYRKQKPDPSLVELRGWLDIAIGETGLTRNRTMMDALGNKVERREIITDLLGFGITNTSEEPALREFARLKKFYKRSELTLATGFQMSPEEYDEFRRTLHEDVGLMDKLNDLVVSERYRRLSYEGKIKTLDRYVRSARRMGKAFMLREDPGLRDTLKEYEKQRMLEIKTPEELPEGEVTLEQIFSTRKKRLNRDTLTLD